MSNFCTPAPDGHTYTATDLPDGGVSVSVDGKHAVTVRVEHGHVVVVAKDLTLDLGEAQAPRHVRGEVAWTLPAWLVGGGFEGQ